MFPEDIFHECCLRFRAINNENDFSTISLYRFPPALSKNDLRINSDQHPKNKSDDGTNKPPENRSPCQLETDTCANDRKCSTECHTNIDHGCTVSSVDAIK